LRRSIGDQGEFGGAGKNDQGARDNFAEGIEQRLEQIHCAARMFSS